MAKISLVWEMGGGFGHVTRLDVLARALKDQGHEVCILTHSATSFAQCFVRDSALPYKIVQVPSTKYSLKKLSRPPANFAEVLLSSGYCSEAWLTQAVSGWKHALRSQNPALVIGDYAPTALLACRDMSIATCMLGDGFVVPPQTDHMPCFPTINTISRENLHLSELKLLTTINQTLAKLTIPQLNKLGDLNSADHHFITTIPELDLYAPWRKREIYLGQLGAASVGEQPLQWSDYNEKPKVFGYLKKSYPKLEELMKNLLDVDIEARIYIPGVDARFKTHYQTQNLHISTSPYSLSDDYRQADLTLCHGGHATILQSVAEGVSVLGIPLQQEQLVNTYLCAKNGFGGGINPNNPTEVTGVIKALYSKEFRIKKEAINRGILVPATNQSLSIILNHCNNLI